MTSTRTTARTFLPGVIAVLLVLCSCRQADKASTTSTDTSAATGEGAAAPEKLKACFQCNGTGKITCPDCQGREEVDCPGHCLKLTHGTWIHMEVAGHPATDVWQKFQKANGGWRAFNQNHVGHIIESKNGDWVDAGVCPICHGTGKIPCLTCKGTGEIVCDLCKGKTVIPESWTPFDNPKHRAEHFAMKNGTTLVGRKIIVIGNHATIQTATKAVEVNTSDILSETKPGLK